MSTFFDWQPALTGVATVLAIESLVFVWVQAKYGKTTVTDSPRAGHAMLPGDTGLLLPRDLARFERNRRVGMIRNQASRIVARGTIGVDGGGEEKCVVGQLRSAVHRFSHGCRSVAAFGEQLDHD
jgi:hypothetical protein